MPLDVGNAVNNFADRLLNAPILNKIARSPIYTALMITLIIIFIIMFVFRDADIDSSLGIMGLRCGFWIFFTLVGALLIHNKILYLETQSVSNKYERVFNGGYSGITLDNKDEVLEESIVPVNINTNFANF